MHVTNILVVLGHPSAQSFNRALCDAYVRTARQAGANVRTIALGELDFDPVLRPDQTPPQALEPSLVEAQEDVVWAHHIVWFFPVWWGTAPALLRGFIDRTFLPGWAFNVKPNGMPIRHLAGRTARTVVTMDAPHWFYRLWYGRSAHRAMERATLWFCGIRVTGRSTYTPIRTSTAQDRARWLEDITQCAKRDVETLQRRPEPVLCMPTPTHRASASQSTQKSV